jgi:hypothetical protein
MMAFSSPAVQLDELYVDGIDSCKDAAEIWQDEVGEELVNVNEDDVDPQRNNGNEDNYNWNEADYNGH